MFSKRAVHVGMSAYNNRLYIQIFRKSSFPKQDPPNLALALQTGILDWCLSRFGKELFNMFLGKQVCISEHVSIAEETWTCAYGGN